MTREDGDGHGPGVVEAAQADVTGRDGEGS